MFRTPVLIVGAGPAGLVLACDLVRRGIRPILVERNPMPSTGSKGKALQPRTLEVFDDLGLVDNVLAAGRTYPKLRFYKNGDVAEERWMYAIEPSSAGVPYPNTIVLPQWKTEELLRQRLAALGGNIEFATTLVDFAEASDGVIATIEGPSGTRIVHAQFLVGADGGRSTVRKLAGIELVGDSPNLEGILAADVVADGLDRGVWHYWMADRDPAVGLCPLPGSDAFQFTAMIGPASAPELTLGTLQTLIDKKSQRTYIRLHSLSWISVFRPNVRVARSFREGRIFIAGDAAHIHPPAGGQGLNTSVQDSYNLGWKLAAVLSGAPWTLLDSYQEERFPIAAEVLNRSDKLYRIEVKGEQAALKRGSSEKQLLLGYRSSSLTAGGGPGLLQPGDRMPDLQMNDSGKMRRLFDLLRGPHTTVIALSAHRISERPWLRSVEIDVNLFEDMDYLLGKVGTYVAVRPDGYIGAIDSSASAINRYLDRILPRESCDTVKPSRLWTHSVGEENSV